MSAVLLPANTAVGCIGLGIMGLPAAQNMQNGGYMLRAYARRPKNLTGLAGIATAESPQALGAACDAVVLNVSDTHDVEEVTLATNGLIGGMRAGGIIIDMSTIAPAAARNIAHKLSQKGIFFLDAPVSGGEKGAIDGTLTVMVGGAGEAFARALPLLQTMGKTITHVGGSGAGQVAKACNQIIIGATIEGVAEALVLAQNNGVDAAAVRRALLGGFAGSKVLEIHGQRMLDGDFAPGFKAALHQKDMGIALDNGAQNNCPLPAARLFAERLQKLIAQNDGALDSSAVYKIVAKAGEQGGGLCK